jgi:DNA-directed RNA polymerase specialized sigma24 family protein
MGEYKRETTDELPIEAERWRLVVAALDKLPEGSREVVPVLHYLEEPTPSEMAADISPSI